jgi:hypothetical protein
VSACESPRADDVRISSGQRYSQGVCHSQGVRLCIRCCGTTSCKKIAESDICKTSANACAGAECKNQVDENSAENARREVFASAVLFVARKLAEQQPGRHCSQWFPVRSSPQNKRITQSQRLVAAPVPGRYRGSTNPRGGDERAALPVVGVGSSVLHKARCLPMQYTRASRGSVQVPSFVTDYHQGR